MEEIYKQQQLAGQLNDAIKTLLDQLFVKLNVASLRGVYFMDLVVEYGEQKNLEANAELIAEIKKMGIQYDLLKKDLEEAQLKLGSMCHDKFEELSAAICAGDKLFAGYLKGEYNLAVSLGGVIPFLTELSKTA